MSGIHVWTIRLAVFVVASSFVATGTALDRFDGRIARPQLEQFLSRAVTMEGLLHEHGNLDDEIRFLKHIGARFAGRAIYLWGGENNLDQALKQARRRGLKLHQAVPELML